ncbi:Gfo/Idh/MocA family oxidoreductase [Hellea sp.]|jgi:2-hydroxy-4-carboxymuconate semialdehyde hemiacetal dehydrogenase|nr:Gfo/Idh/MocA family oxidoreductase [Hellea sp.]MDB4844891.1 Gfo/Idh/MocA family oxidoreductase [Hellea sp.]MDC0650636.1 Gfo/Idh/MocA family oxidoreductase [Hellea sp.]MDC1062207.1 Gfo/Idh/MocA family oxidoreductase [Hellea sp.]MDC1089284.1 Gfo/Idh/MocA family oxidoreductase [Hellea sp.]
MKVVVAGEGAFGRKHLAALANIDGIEVVSLAGGVEQTTEKVAGEYKIPHWSLDLSECLAQPGVDAAILVTPTPIHAKQAMQVLDAGKHVFVEIPMADNIEDSRALAEKAKAAGLVAMVGHVRRFNPPHQWVHNKILSGDLSIQQMDVTTFFFRRINTNALGEPRSWTDHILWHHAAHTIDLFMYQTGEEVSDVYAVAGPINAELGIHMDMAIIMRTPSGKICNLSLSFNNEGPLGTNFRYICDNGTYTAYYDDINTGFGEHIDVSEVDVSTNGIELMQREFFAAIHEGREPNGSVAKILPTMEVIDKIQQLVGN